MILYSWRDVRTDIRKLLKQIDSRVDVIIGLSRGGLIPGIMLSHEMGIPFIPVVWQTRDGQLRQKEILEKYNDKYTLIIDDLVDTGTTMNEIKEVAPKCKFGVLINKRKEIDIDFCSRTLYNNKQWIVFPWEKKIED
jgi:hypoxanthine phosphoribosyltransferase